MFEGYKRFKTKRYGEAEKRVSLVNLLLSHIIMVITWAIVNEGDGHRSRSSVRENCLLM